MTKSINKILHTLIDNKMMFQYGLCTWGYNLVRAGLLSWKEYDIFLVYVKLNRPHMLSSLAAFKSRKSGFFWKDSDIVPRIKWVEKHIKKTKRKDI